MTIAELSRVDRAIEIQAPPESVWRALTTKEELSAWFHVTIDGEIAAGQEIWMTMLHEQYAGIRFSVNIVELTPPSRFVWQWHPGAVDPNVDYGREPRTTVTFALEPCPAGTRLSVAETGFDQISLDRRAKVHQDNTQGWAEVVVWIRNHAEASH
jgi:uncharacterized protein YndB with AHSA1/START domain